MPPFPRQTTQGATLSFPNGGRVADVAVQIGDVVKAGDSPASLDMTALALAVGRAPQTLLIEQANLAMLQRARRPAVGALSDRLQDINGVLCHNATDRLRYLLNESWREKRL